jgi:methylated-DNA-[protein]-cysteine S-methyltransferase
MRAPVSHDYAAKLAAPFAVLGIRTSGAAVTGIEYLPKADRAKAPANALAERAWRQLERNFADPEFHLT